MITLTVAEAGRNFSKVLDRVERGQEEVLLVRNRRRIARLVPEPPSHNALAVLGDLYCSLDNDTASSLSEAIKRGRKGRASTLDALKNPWGS